MNTRTIRLGLVAVLCAVAAIQAIAGVQLITPDIIAGSGLVFALGEIDMKGLTELIEKQGRAWEEFKSANDARLKAIEEKGYAPADLIGKVDALNGELTKLSAECLALQVKANRPGTGGDGKIITPEQEEHKRALGRYLRKGEDANLHALERKAMSAFSDPDGGYLVDEAMESAIDRIAAAQVAMRRLARVVPIGSPVYEKLVKTRGVSGGWIGESEDSSESTEPQFSRIQIPVWRLYAEPWVPNDLLEDAVYDLEGDLGVESGITFGETEGTAWINGTGVKQPRGFLSYSIVANASYAWGKIGYIASGASGAFAASNPGDKLIDLQHALKPAYRNGATWLMSDATLASVRQMKDGSGAYYLWQPDPLVGFGGRLLGSPVETDDYMPTIAANSYSISYGNFQRGYTIVDRRGVAVIRDQLTKKGTTKFHLSKRVGGGVTNFEAIKVMKFAAS